MEDYGTAGRLLLITAAGRQYALSVAEVERVAVLRADAVSPVPFDATGRIRGIYSDRGTATVLLHCAGWDCDDDGREEMTVVVLRDKNRRFAVAVDEASAVVGELPDASIQCLSARSLFEGDDHDNHQ